MRYWWNHYLHRKGSKKSVGDGEQGIGDNAELNARNCGDKWQFERDHQLMLNLQGEERNREEFIELAGRAGFKVVRFWILGGVESAIVECKKKSTDIRMSE
jgi:hypothetical protein